MSPVIYVGAAIAAVALLFALRGWFLFTFRWNINVYAFMQQLEKLIMANNIDRAIKICNAEPIALLPKVIKSLLTRANRAYALLLTHEQAMAELRATVATYRTFGTAMFVAFMFALSILALGLGQGLEGQELQILQGCMVAAAAGIALTWFNQMRVNRHVHVIGAASLEIRDMLYKRGNYKPPQYEPVEMTDEEIAEWRRSMDYVESEAVKVGPGTAADLHDSMVNRRTGALPPL